MIHIVDITVRGVSDLGEFRGSMAFAPGLQVIAANNRYGKSLAVTSIAWCLGLERMFGLRDNDPSRFSVAVRDVIELAGKADVPVQSSHAELTLERDDGARIRLTRAIKGDPSIVKVEEFKDGTSIRTSVLFARRQTMKDETGGLQNFLFEWCHLPRVNVVNTRGEVSELYLENIAPLFYIDQNEGWTDLQALQVHRYGLLEISDVAVEYLLGALDSIEARFIKQSLAANEGRLKAEALSIAQRVNAFFQRHGWSISWSDHGSVDSIAKRWGARTLARILKTELNVDLALQRNELKERAQQLRTYLASGDIDPVSGAAASDSSQAVVELKQQRHARRQDLRLLRRQLAEQSELLENIDHRLRSARDILRLKTEGIGRLEMVECPTCHRSIDPSTFGLTTQSEESVRAHIDALARDRKLVASNIESCERQIVRITGNLTDVERHLQDAERALAAVNQAVGAAREQLTKAATDLITVENELDRLSSIDKELLELQASIDGWVERSKSTNALPVYELDLDRRKGAFVARLHALLRALGHGAILAQPDALLELNEHYVPYLGPRRLRSLGSASDHSRLVAAYVLALAVAAQSIQGPHPGFVVLDEPLQQNPDEPHRDLFIDFLTSGSKMELPAQTLVFTWLHEPELRRVIDAGVHVLHPTGEHFLELVPPSSQREEQA